MAGPGSAASPNAPDGGWGWFVVMASFTLQALTIGITYTFGVIFVDLLDYFKEGQSTTAWIGSIQPCLLYLTGKIHMLFLSLPALHIPFGAGTSFHDRIE